MAGLVCRAPVGRRAHEARRAVRQVSDEYLRPFERGAATLEIRGGCERDDGAVRVEARREAAAGGGARAARRDAGGYDRAAREREDVDVAAGAIAADTVDVLRVVRRKRDDAAVLADDGIRVVVRHAIRLGSGP